jgi:hypothetical protein
VARFSFSLSYPKFVITMAKEKTVKVVRECISGASTKSSRSDRLVLPTFGLHFKAPPRVHARLLDNE